MNEYAKFCISIRLANARYSAEAVVGHASGKVRSGEQITRHGAALCAY